MNILRFGMKGTPFAQHSENGLNFRSSLSNSFFVAPSKNTFERSYSTPKGKFRGAFVARFPYDTYLDGKGIQINPPQREDTSAIVGLSKPPKGHTEAKDEAARWGFHGLYLKNDSHESVYTIGFNDTTPSSTSLQQYTEERKQRFFEKYPQGQISEVALNSSVTNHLKHNQLSFQALLFDAVTQANPYEHPLGKMVLFLKTPGGFWDLGWHSVISSLRDSKHQAMFAEVVKDFKANIREKTEIEPEHQKSEEITLPTKKIIE